MATCGRLSEAPTPPLLAVGGLPENPTLSTKKKNTVGGNSKMIQGAVFLAGRVPALPAQASGLSLRDSLEIGSSFGIKCHQILQYFSNLSVQQSDTSLYFSKSLNQKSSSSVNSEVHRTSSGSGPLCGTKSYNIFRTLESSSSEMTVLG